RYKPCAARPYVQHADFRECLRRESSVWLANLHAPEYAAACFVRVWDGTGQTFAFLRCPKDCRTNAGSSGGSAPHKHSPGEHWSAEFCARAVVRACAPALIRPVSEERSQNHGCERGTRRD